jgi:hypothetical protein
MDYCGFCNNLKGHESTNRKFTADNLCRRCPMSGTISIWVCNVCFLEQHTKWIQELCHNSPIHSCLSNIIVKEYLLLSFYGETGHAGVCLHCKNHICKNCATWKSWKTDTGLCFDCAY